MRKTFTITTLLIVVFLIACDCQAGWLFGRGRCPGGRCPTAPDYRQEDQQPSNTGQVDLRTACRIKVVVGQGKGGTKRLCLGSGGVVDWGEPLVLTAKHIAKRIGMACWVRLNGEDSWREGVVIAVDASQDLAAIRLKNTLDVPAAPIDATSVATGDRLVKAGFGGRGKFRAYVGDVFMHDRKFDYVRTFTQDGDSGGPIYRLTGKLVGILWASQTRVGGEPAVFSSGDKIAKFLRRTIGERPKQSQPLTQADPNVPDEPPSGFDVLESLSGVVDQAIDAVPIDEPGKKRIDPAPETVKEIITDAIENPTIRANPEACPVSGSTDTQLDRSISLPLDDLPTSTPPFNFLRLAVMLGVSLLVLAIVAILFWPKK